MGRQSESLAWLPLRIVCGVKRGFGSQSDSVPVTVACNSPVSQSSRKNCEQKNFERAPPTPAAAATAAAATTPRARARTRRVAAGLKISCRSPQFPEITSTRMSLGRPMHRRPHLFVARYPAFAQRMNTRYAAPLWLQIFSHRLCRAGPSLKLVPGMVTSWAASRILQNA